MIATVRAVNIFNGQYEKLVYPTTKNGGPDWPEWIDIDLAEYRRLQQELPIEFVDGEYVAFDIDAQIAHAEYMEHMSENAWRGTGWL